MSRLENLPNSTAAAEHDEPLSWSELNVKDAAYSNDDIWEQVDFAADSSDEDFISITSDELSSRLLPDTPSGSEHDYILPDGLILAGQDDELIASIEKAQFWKNENHPPVSREKQEASRSITELQLARETIFMLQGLPTSIFWRLDGDIEVDRTYTLAHCSSKTLSSLLRQFTEIGARLDHIRRFTKLGQTIPYMQTFCRGVEERLLDVDGCLSQTQGQYHSGGSIVSMLQLLDDVSQRSRPLILLSELVSKLESAFDQPIRCLNSLYNLVCMLEALGDEVVLKDLAALFFSCFKTYTRSVQIWMETGQINPQESAFFVRSNSTSNDLRTLWHEWYVLDERIVQLKLPQFLQHSARKVFTAGKSMVFLRHLNALPDHLGKSKHPGAIFDSMCSIESLPSLPFSALVESAFDKLVDANHAISAGLLRTELDEQCGLWVSLDALHHVYLGKDVSVLSTIDTKIFELMDRGRPWDDKFVLTELARSAFSALPTIDPSRLIARSGGVASRKLQNRTVHHLQSISLDYVLPWSVANIITQDAIETYRRIAVFLMQIRRAKYVITRQRVRDGRRAIANDRDSTPVYVLHHSLLWFLDLLYSHLTYTVISTMSESLRSALSRADDMDAMISAHQSYMSSLEEECLLKEDLAPIHEAIINLLDLCIHFADLQAARTLDDESSEQDMNDGRNTLSPGRIDDGVDSDSDDEFADAEPDSHEHTLTISFHDSSYEQQMRNVKRQSDHLLAFIADGLKGVARAGGLPSWNMLADKLEWRKGWLRN